MKLLLPILLILLTLTTKAQKENERILYAKVFEITKIKGHRVDCKALSSDGCVINIKYGFKKWVWTKCPVKIGSIIEIHSLYKRRYDDWICSKIYLN